MKLSLDIFVEYGLYQIDTGATNNKHIPTNNEVEIQNLGS